MAFTTQNIYCQVLYSLSECFRSEAYSEPRQTSKMDLFAKIVHGFRLLTIFVKALS